MCPHRLEIRNLKSEIRNKSQSEQIPPRDSKVCYSDYRGRHHHRAVQAAGPGWTRASSRLQPPEPPTSSSTDPRQSALGPQPPSGTRRADGHGLSAGRSMAGRGRRRGIVRKRCFGCRTVMCVLTRRGCGGWGVTPLPGERNPKLEIRNPKQISNLKFKIRKKPPPPAPLRSGQRGAGCDLWQFRQPGEDHALRGGRLGGDPAMRAGVTIAAEIRGVRPGRHAPLVRRAVRGRGRRAGAAGASRARRPAGRCWPSTTGSIWPSIRFPIRAGSRPARRCGWGCR